MASALDVIKGLRARLAGDAKGRVSADDMEKEALSAESTRDRLAIELLELEQRRPEALMWGSEAKIKEIDEAIATGRIRRETLDALIPRLRTEIENRRRQESIEALEARRAELIARIERAVVWILGPYAELADKLAGGLAELETLDNDIELFASACRDGQLGFEPIPPLRAGLDTSRRRELRELWGKGAEAVSLPSPFREHSPVLAFWPRDPRITSADRIAVPELDRHPAPQIAEQPGPVVGYELNRTA